MRHGLEAERLLRRAQDEDLRPLASVAVAYPFVVVGRLAEAAAQFEKLVQATRARPELGLEDWGFSTFVWASLMTGAVDALTGKLAAARTQLEHSIELARQYGEAENEGWAVMWLADLAFFAGDEDAGLPAGRRSVELAEKFGSPYSRFGAYQRLGVALLLDGQVREAITTLEHAFAIGRQCGTGLEREASALAWLAEAVLAAGDVTRARALADEALAVADRIGAVLDGILARRTLVRVLLAQAGATAAGAIEEALDGAERLIEQTGAISYRPLVLRERAELARRAGDDAARQRALREAQRLFTAMSATGHAARVAQELGS